MSFRFLIPFLFLFLRSDFTGAQNADINLLRKINVHRNTHLDKPLKIITYTVPVLAPIIPLTNIGIGLYNNDKVLTRQGLVAGSSLALALGISTGFKFAIKRKRPFAQYEDIQKETKAGPYSFPSGHTTSAFALATAYSLAYPKWYVIAPAYLWAGTVAWSRMHLGVHFPSDVLAGILIGAGSSLLCYEVQKGIK
ncbi:MAG: phosphatase PAP2 family protein [Bacteroidia bacterium]